MFHHTVYVYRQAVVSPWTMWDESYGWCSDLMTVAMAAKWIEEGHKHHRETEQKMIFLTCHYVFASRSTSLALFFLNTHTHTHALTAHQPVVQSSGSSFGSVSCKGLSLGQQGGVQQSDSLSRNEACMANCGTRLLLKREKPHKRSVATRHLADSW